MRRLLTIFALAWMGPRASAEPAFASDSQQPPPAEPAPVVPELAPVTVPPDAPLPGHESGRTDAVDDGDTTTREVGRVVLTPVRWMIDGVLFPVRGTLWAQDRYHLDALYMRVFFNHAQTIGLYPTLAFESGFGYTGITGGARFVAKSLLGYHEELSLQAAAGMAYEFRQLYGVKLTSGQLLGERVSLEADLGYELRPRDAFYGLGNTLMPLSRFSQDRSRAIVTGDVHVWRGLHVRPAGSLVDRSFGNPTDGTPTGVAYNPPGFTGYSGAYGELELRWDGRHSNGYWDQRGSITEGSLAAAFAGRFHRLDGGPDFWRYGFDLQHFFRIAIGPRVIMARLHGEAVNGTREQVPFTELPSLGGPLYLRGYELDQFRDRIAAFGTLAYGWDLSSWMGASLFVDVGRVYQHLHQLTLDDMRVGYGFGLVIHHGGDFITELSVASSLDGGFFLNLSFNPVYDIETRVRRR